MPKKNVQGVSISLKACGADEVHELRDGTHECRINLLSLLELADNRRLNYVSVPQNTQKLAIRAACVEILSYILFRGPRFLRVHLNEWTHPQSVQVLRDEAEYYLRTNLGVRPCGQWSPLQERDDNIPTRTNPEPSRSRYVEPTADEDMNERKTRVLQALTLMPRGREHGNPRNPRVWQVLVRDLPRGAFIPFLREFPHLFEVVSEKPLIWKRR